MTDAEYNSQVAETIRNMKLLIVFYYLCASPVLHERKLPEPLHVFIKGGADTGKR